jgi:hypothetical protein
MTTMTTGDAEEAARLRVQQLEQAAREGHTLSLDIDHAAAVRALDRLPPECLRLVWGMVTVHALRGGGTQRDLREAARVMGDTTMPWELFEHLHHVGLLTVNESGAHRLHPLFGSVAHRLNEIACDAVHDGGGGASERADVVVPMTRGR